MWLALLRPSLYSRPDSRVTGSVQVRRSADHEALESSRSLGKLGGPPVQDIPLPIGTLNVTLMDCSAGSTSAALLAGSSVTTCGGVTRFCTSSVAPCVAK